MYSQKEREEVPFKRMHVFVFGEPSLLFVCHLFKKTMEGSRLSDQRASDNEKKRFVPIITATPCRIIKLSLTDKNIVLITIQETETFLCSFKVVTHFLAHAPCSFLFSSLILMNLLDNKKKIQKTQSYYEARNSFLLLTKYYWYHKNNP